LIPFILWFGWFAYTTVDNKRKDRLQEARDQIANLYGPSYNLSAAMENIWEDLGKPLSNASDEQRLSLFIKDVSVPLGGKIETALFSGKQVVRCPEIRDALHNLVSFVEFAKFRTSTSDNTTKAGNRDDMSMSSDSIDRASEDLVPPPYPYELSTLLMNELNALHEREEFLDNGFFGLNPWGGAMPSCQGLPLGTLLTQNQNLSPARETRATKNEDKDYEATLNEIREVSEEECGGCHSFRREAVKIGAPEWDVDRVSTLLIGPPLWGVVGRRVASIDGFNYSPALREIDGVWDYYKLNAFIACPQSEAPKTRMGTDCHPNEVVDIPACLRVLLVDAKGFLEWKAAPLCDGFPGEPKPEKRAEILAYLRTLAEVQVPFPGENPPVGGPAYSP